MTTVRLDDVLQVKSIRGDGAEVIVNGRTVGVSRTSSGCTFYVAGSEYHLQMTVRGKALAAHFTREAAGCQSKESLPELFALDLETALDPNFGRVARELLLSIRREIQRPRQLEAENVHTVVEFAALQNCFRDENGLVWDVPPLLPVDALWTSPVGTAFVTLRPGIQMIGGLGYIDEVKRHRTVFFFQWRAMMGFAAWFMEECRNPRCRVDFRHYLFG